MCPLQPEAIQTCRIIRLELESSHHTTTMKHRLLQNARDLQNVKLRAPLLELHFATAVQLNALAKLYSEEVGLLHDSQELFFVHLAISITVCLINHLLELLVGHALAELLGNPLQVLEGDFACLVVIEEAERLEELILRVAIQNLVGHHFQEFLIA